MNKLAVPHILAVLTPRVSLLKREGRPRVRKKLLAGFVQAHQRTLLIKRPLVNVQHVFQAEDELRVLLGRNAPALLQPGLKFIFFSVWRTVSCEIVSVICCSISVSFKRCRLQRA